VIDLDHVARALGRHEPELLTAEDRRRAAVAMVLHDARQGPEVLLIERARQERDPWSGHMAFPGGRVEAGDPHPRATAERETREEVGIALHSAEHLGQLDDLQGRGPAPQGLVISGHVYRLPERAELEIDPREVAQAFWFPLAGLHDRTRHIEHTYPGGRTMFPGILVGEPGRHVVWGLTYRFLELFFGIVGRPLPARWSFERDELMR